MSARMSEQLDLPDNHAVRVQVFSGDAEIWLSAGQQEYELWGSAPLTAEQARWVVDALTRAIEELS